MKKFLTLLLAAMMLLALMPALAETTAAETQLLTSPDGSYTIEVPADFIPVNAETMMTLLSDEAMQQLIAQVMGLTDASQMWDYIELLDASNMMIIYGPDMYSNLNVQATKTPLTMEQMTLLKDLLDQTIIQQYASVGVSEEHISLLPIQEVGGRSWYTLQVEFAGMQLRQWMTVENGVQYALNFGSIDPQVMTSILESFTIVAQ